MQMKIDQSIFRFGTETRKLVIERIIECFVYKQIRFSHSLTQVLYIAHNPKQVMRHAHQEKIKKNIFSFSQEK